MVSRRRSHQGSSVRLGILLAGVALAVSLLAASSARGQSLSLTTLFAADSQAAGNTFDLQVKDPGGVEVESLDVNIGTGSVQVGVWTRPGTSVGFEDAMTGWTSRGSASVSGAGLNLPTKVPIGFSLPAGDHGVAVAITDSVTVSMQYTVGAPTAFEDGQLKLTTSRGLGPPPLNGGGFFNSRQWNGTIHYSRLTAQCKSLQSALAAAAMSLTAAEGALAEADQALGVANDALGSASKSVDRAKGKKRRATKKVAKAKKRLKRARRSGDRGEVRKAKKGLERAKERLRSAKRRLRDAKDELASAEAAVAAAQSNRDRARSNRDRARANRDLAQTNFNANCT